MTSSKGAAAGQPCRWQQSAGSRRGRCTGRIILPVTWNGEPPMNVQDRPHVEMTERLPPASARRPMQDGPVSERRADAPTPYQGFDGQYINGSWRPGRHGGVQIEMNTGIGSFERHWAAPGCAVNLVPSPQKRLYPKTLSVFLDASPSGKHRAVHAVALAQRWDAHVIGVHVVFAGVRLYPPSESWAIGERVFQAVIAYEKRLRANAEAVAAHLIPSRCCADSGRPC